nr:DNA polymerase Y family protein [Sphingobium phenoxybenzoativorans]
MTKDASSNRRFLALWFPFLPLDRLRIAEPARWSPPAEQGGLPTATVEKVRGAMRLSAVDADALALGISPGMTLADARARIPELRVFDCDPYADQDWLERLCDGARRYTPMAALDPPHGLALDITGCAHLFGGEQELADDALERLSHFGMRVRHALGSTPEAAHALARFPAAPAPDEASALRRLPVAALRLEDESELALRRAGLKTVGDVASRPSAALAARFGAEAVDALHRLLGEAARPLDPRHVPPAIALERRFPEPVARTAYALAVLEELAGEAAGRLAERGQGGRRFAATFFRSDGMAFPLRVETSLPVRDPKAVMRLFRERIDSLSDPIDPGFGFDLVRLAVPAAEPLGPTQLALEGGEERSREGGEGTVSGLVDALSTRAGRHRILRLAPCDTHIPEQAQLALPAVEARAPAAWDAPEAGEPPLRPVHLFDPPQRIDVMAGIPEGPPVQFRWRRSLHQIARYEGPERVAPEWWRDTTPREAEARRTRDYFRVEDARGRRFWIFRNGLYGDATPQPLWYLHGLFA